MKKLVRTDLPLFLVIVLAMSLLTAVQPFTASATDEPIDDSAEASQQAEETGQQVVVPSETTSTTQVFANPDGTFTAEIASGPVRVPDAESANGWEPVDTTLVDTGEILEPEAAAASISFSDGGAGELATLAVKDQSYSLGWLDSLPAPVIEGSRATYADVLPGIDLVLEARPTGYSKQFIVHSEPTEPVVLRFPVELRGLQATLGQNDRLSLVDDQGSPVAAADPARMWGAELGEHTDEPTHQSLVPTTLVETADGAVLELAPDPAFFADPDVSYPITIDPSPDLSVFLDTYVDSSLPNTSFHTDTFLKSGSHNDGGTKFRSYLKFNGVSALSGSNVLNASLKVYETWSYSCQASWVEVLGLQESFGTGTNWNNKPQAGAIYASKQVAKGYSASCPSDWVEFTDGGTGGISMTTMVQQWANGSQPSHGMMIRAQNETNSQGWKKFKSGDSGSNVPLLTVNYVWSPNVPSALSLEPSDETPELTLHATFSDNDGGTGRVIYSIADTGGTPVATNVQGTWVSSGEESTATVDAGILELEPFEDYSWTAVASDGTYSSSPSSPQSFTYEGYENQDMLQLAAEEMAPEFGVPVAQLKDDLAMQPEISEFGSFLENDAPPSFGGFYIDYAPTLSLTLLAEEGHVENMEDLLEEAEYQGYGTEVALTDIEETPISQADLLEQLEMVNDVVPDEATGTDIRTGSVIVKVEEEEVQETEQTLADYEEETAGTSEPFTDNNVDVIADPPQEVRKLVGGKRLVGEDATCTSGFTVIKPSNGHQGLLTAGHCRNSMEYGNTNVHFTDNDMVNTQQGENVDAQWWHLPNHTYPNRIIISKNGNTTSITSITTRGDMRIGEVICGYGKAMKAKCAQITDKHASGDADGQNQYSNNFVEVSKPSGGLCRDGDSGGPWYDRHSAFGMTHSSNDAGTTCTFMAVQYLSNAFSINVKTS